MRPLNLVAGRMVGGSVKRHRRYMADYLLTEMEPLYETAAGRVWESSRFDPAIGICNNVTSEVHHHYDALLTELMESWPKFSGISNFPVPAPEGFVPEGTDFAEADLCVSAYYGLPKWEGDYGALRMELLAYMIDECRRILS